MIRIRGVSIVVVLALVAVACGGRVSEEQVRAEQAEDLLAAGVGFTEGGNEAAGGRTNGVGPGAAFAESDSVSLGLEGNSSLGFSGDGSAPTGSDPGSVGNEPGSPPAPAAGNGGATDVGITETEVVIGNVSTLSGPVPGLFRGALVGTQAWFAYQNSLGGLYGRQFRVESGDDNFDTGTNRSAHRSLKDKVFAFSGSFSLFDAASVGEMKSVGVVDIGRALSPARQDYERHYSMVPFGIGWPTTGCQWLKDRFGDQVIKNMAIFWGNADAARDNASWQRAACESVGFEFKYSRQVEATESNFTADVVQMRRQNIQGFFIIYDASGIGRFLADMESQGYDPPLQYPSPAAYDSDLVKFAGKAGVEGIIIGQNMSMFLGEDAVAVPEIVTFNEWVRRIDPNQKFDLFALYGWAAGQLLTNAMTAAGPEVTREKVLAELAKTTSYNASGLHSVHNVAAKAPSVCEMYMEGTADGGFRRIFPDTGFYCEGTFHQYTG